MATKRKRKQLLEVWFCCVGVGVHHTAETLPELLVSVW